MRGRGGKRANSGRKPVPDERKRDVRLMARMEPALAELFERKAKENGQTVSSRLRLLVERDIESEGSGAKPEPLS